jgi:hypothetical protein
MSKRKGAHEHSFLPTGLAGIRRSGSHGRCLRSGGNARLQEPPGLLVSAEQRLNAPPQVGIIAASFDEVSGALRLRLAIERAAENRHEMAFGVFHGKIHAQAYSTVPRSGLKCATNL